MIELLNRLSSTTKRNEKEQILKNLPPEQQTKFKRLAFLTYDPSIDFYIKEFETRQPHESTISLDVALDILESDLATRNYTGNAAKGLVENVYQSLCEDDSEVLYRVIQRDLDVGVGTKTINKIFPDTIYDHPYMRCSAFNEKNLKNITYPCYSQTKMDGLYCDIMVFDDHVEYRTRNGSFLDLNDENLDASLIHKAQNTVLMGECIAVDEAGNLLSRKESNGYLNSQDIDVSRVVFYIWDCVPLADFQKRKSTLTYSDRLNDIDTILHAIHSERLKLISTRYCEDQNDIMEHFRDMRELGEEGTIIKDFSNVWKPGTSKTQVKLKVIFEAELLITGYKEGTGKYAGMLGAITFESSDGKVEVSVGTGFKDSEREQWWNEIDQWVEQKRVATIRANDIVDSEQKPDKLSLFLPRFVELRTDKDTADSAEQIDEQVKSFTNALKMIGG